MARRCLCNVAKAQRFVDSPRPRHKLSERFAEAWDDRDQSGKPDLSGLLIFDPRRWHEVRHAHALAKVRSCMQVAAVAFGGQPAPRMPFDRAGYGRLIDQLYSVSFTMMAIRRWPRACRRAERESNYAYPHSMTDYLDRRTRRKLRD